MVRHMAASATSESEGDLNWHRSGHADHATKPSMTVSGIKQAMVDPATTMNSQIIPWRVLL